MINIDENRAAYKRRFDWCRDSMIPTYFEGHIGTGRADSEGRWVIIRSGDFYFCAGEPVGIEEAVRDFIKDHSVAITENNDWIDAIGAAGAKATTFTRYRTELPAEGFDKALLEGLINNAGSNVRVVRAGEQEYPLLRDCTWENAFVFNFKDMDDFLTNGFAFCVFVDNELASASSTYGYYSGGYELQIATAPKYRRRGLAAVAGAAFILECLRRGKTPHWDAANETSVRLAQRLGFRFAGEYLGISVDKIADE